MDACRDAARCCRTDRTRKLDINPAPFSARKHFSKRILLSTTFSSSPPPKVGDDCVRATLGMQHSANPKAERYLMRDPIV